MRVLIPTLFLQNLLSLPELPELQTMADQVRTAHLLIKHTGSRNPVSRRTGEQVSLSPESALEELKSYEARIRQEGVSAAFPKYGES